MFPMERIIKYKSFRFLLLEKIFFVFEQSVHLFFFEKLCLNYLQYSNIFWNIVTSKKERKISLQETVYVHGFCRKIKRYIHPTALIINDYES